MPTSLSLISSVSETLSSKEAAVERIFKLGIGVARPGEVYHTVTLEAEDAEGFAAQLKEAWAIYSDQAQHHSDPDAMLHLVVEVDDTGWGDFELEDAVLELLDD